MMVSASARVTTRRVGSGWLPAVILSVTAAAGCGDLHMTRRADKPAFGAEPVAQATPDGPVPAQYASRLSQSSSARQAIAARAPHAQPHAVPPAVLAGVEPARDPAPAPAAAPSVTVADAGPAPQTGIDLQSPVALTPAPDPLDPPAGSSAALADTSTPPPAPAGATADGLDAVVAAGRQAVESLVSYQVTMSHQERVGGQLNPPEDVVMSVRRQPRAVRLAWPSGPHEGRDVLYDSQANGGLMHINMGAKSLVPRVSLPTDSPLATRNSRHPISEAGFDTIVDHLAEALRRQHSGEAPAGSMRLEAREVPEGYDHPCDKVVRTTSQNETWVVLIDPATHLPAFVQATAADGQLLERYVFRNPVLNPPALVAAGAFDPDTQWGAAKGFFGRLAGANPSSTATR